MAICKPSPQGTTSDVLQDSRDIDIKEDNINTEVNKKEEDENNDVGTAVADIFGDVLDLFNGALVTAEEIAGNEVKLTIFFDYLCLKDPVLTEFTSSFCFDIDFPLSAKQKK